MSNIIIHKRCFHLGRKAMTNLYSILKGRDITFANKGPYHQSYGFSSSHVQMWELNHKEGWAPKNWCFWTVVRNKGFLRVAWLQGDQTSQSQLTFSQSWRSQPCIFTGRTDGEAPILWPPDAKSWLIQKDSDAGKDWGQEKGVTEDEIVGWHHRLNGHEFEQTPGESEGQGSLACCSPWGLKELDMT